MHFLQSAEWQELQKETGCKVLRVKDILLIQHILPFGKSYLYIGGAPFEPAALEEIKKIAKEEKAMFLKWEPMSSDAQNEVTLQGAALPSEALAKAGFHCSFKALQPQETIVLDLTKSEDELLAQMHPKTRYNIGLAERHGVRVQVFANPSGEVKEHFIRLLQETAARDGFHLHPSDYYEKLWRLEGMEVFAAFKEDKMLAAAFILFHESNATYLHGASDHSARSLMAPHFLHWEIMKDAKRRDCTLYDLWGIDERRWPGVTRFKRGFGGEEVYYTGSWDFIFQPLFYALYKAWGLRRR